ncbi:MAG TPA: Rrf2 family transcriptional regulator [Rhodospirillales bacterium]|nr:MAG: HTH-type transcriptional regulator IscR [Alphaproteobacteria bacterium MarineAlpha3_Bin6]HHZ76174.1 Rrf2 family transcriptional regulator [Rhodospirillales bacterium]HIA82756.1 Rrf2 family transcriptional regulator [Rhodospirillales bacterium]HIB21602.1 Rrf2 family transcriptional regulator [Rhodospirillales bacterium]HIN74811.1 Rrf2 family transcriptional regulator [Rhodospirillales bacterium]
MLTLSNKIMYSIEAVVDIAYYSNGQPVQSQRISSRQRTPGRYLEQSLQKLVKANILTGVRGPRGGYQLARERRRISVGEIVCIVTDLETENAVENNLTDSEISGKVLNPMWGKIQNTILEQLDKITIEDLCIKANERGIQSEGRQTLDYAI